MKRVNDGTERVKERVKERVRNEDWSRGGIRHRNIVRNRFRVSDTLSFCLVGQNMRFIT